MAENTYRSIIIGVFMVEALLIPVVAMGWVFVLCAPELLIQPTVETAFMWSFLLYPVIWLVAFLAALKELDDEQSKLPTKYAAVPALLVAVHVVAALGSGVF